MDKTTVMKGIIKILKEVWIGFKIAEANRHHCGWGKF
jgi:hypothetical protein